jgi:predicted nucleic acid-binding protein
MVVVADTSPVNYLVLIDCMDVLRILYGRVVIPVEVFSELTAEGAPASVAAWIPDHPEWIEVRHAPQGTLPEVAASLDAGEAAAIRLALIERDSLLLIDESAGRRVADKLGVPNTGTLGVLVDAAAEGLVDLRSALEKLRRTNFRVSQSLIERLTQLSPE